MFARWAVIHRHDGSPVDGLVFIHKPKAEQMRKQLNRPDKYRVVPVNLEVADQ